MFAKHTKRQTIVLVIAYLCLAHFVVGIAFTVRFYAGAGDLREGIWFVLPYVGLGALFIVSILLGHLRRSRGSGALLLLGVLLGAASFIYDLKNDRGQFSGHGAGHTYTIWWWYYEPLFQGYQPGNI